MIADFGQRMENGRKVPSSINGEQIFNIFKDKPFGSIIGRRAFEESNDFKKERASFACKPSLSARYRNVLTRESACPEVDSRQADSRVRTFLYLADNEGLQANEALSFL